MEIPKSAIEKAIEGGWRKPLEVKDVDKLFERGYFSGDMSSIPLDPLFWQALSKACGWSDKCVDCYLWFGREDKDQYANKMCKAGSHLRFDKVSNHPWHDAAMRFYDLILQGKDTTDYWTEILK